MLLPFVLLALLCVLLDASAWEEEACTAGNSATSECLLKPRHANDNDEWDTSFSSKLYTSRCTLARVDRMTPALLQDFIKKDVPVVFPADPVDRNAAFVDMCKRSSLLAKYGDHEVVLSSSNAHSYEKTRSTLRDYILNNMGPQTLDASADKTKYQFGDNYLPGWKEFLANYKRPPFLDADKKGSLSFGMGGDGSGVPFHRHGHVFAEVLHGHKRWLLYPTSRPTPPFYHPNVTSLRWTLETYPQLPETDLPEECVLGPGEIIYIPNNWWHATLNLGESVFISCFV